MRPHLLAFAVLTSLAATAGAQGASDREKAGLVGRVKAVRAESVHATPADDYGFPVGKETFAYTKGRLTASRLVDPKGRVLESRTYAYGSASTYERITISNGAGRAYEERYTRGPGDRIETIRYVSGTKEGGTTAFTYRGAPDKPDEVAFFRPDGGRATAPIGPCLGAHRVVYRYVDGRISERALYEVDGSLKRKSSFKYDDHGNMTEEARADGPMTSLIRYEHRYDDRGNWIRRIETVRYDVGRAPDRESSLVRIRTRTIAYF